MSDTNQLQILQQNIQHLSLQKQQVQKNLTEIESALKGLETTEKAYKIVGNIMVSSDKKSLQKDLQEKKEVMKLRVKNFDEQEKKLKEKVEEVQKKVLGELKNEQDKRSD